MLDNIKRVTHNKTIIRGGLFSLYSFINQGTNFLLLIVLANYILPDDYGRLSLFNTVLTFIGYFMAFSTSGYLSISFFKKENVDEFRKDFTAIIIMAVLSLSIFLLLSILLSILNLNVGFPSHLLVYAVLIAFFICVVNMLLDYLRVNERVVDYGIVSCSNAILNFGLTLVLIIFFNAGWQGRVISQVLCYFLFFVFSLFFYCRSNLFFLDLNWSRYKSMLKWGLPLIPHAASVWIRQGLDRYIIDYYHTTYDVGLFSFALNLVSVIIMIGVAFNSANSVSIFQTLSGSNVYDKKAVLKKQTQEIFAIYAIATIVVSLSVVFLVPLVLPQYSGSILYFEILSIYGFLQCLYFLVCNFLFYFKKTKELMFITFGTSLIHLLVSFTITRYSLVNTCLIYVFVQLLIVFLVTRKSRLLLKTI